MIRKGMAVVTAPRVAVERGTGRMGAWLGGDLIFGQNNAAGGRAARVLRWKAFGGRGGETGAVVPRG
jgi:hypothetical protein